MMSNLTMPFLLSNLEKHIKTGWNHLFSGHFYKKLTWKPIQNVKFTSTPSTTQCTRWPATKPATARRSRACWTATSANNANSSTSAVFLTSKLRSYVRSVRACAIFCRALHLHHSLRYFMSFYQYAPVRFFVEPCICNPSAKSISRQCRALHLHHSLRYLFSIQ